MFDWLLNPQAVYYKAQHQTERSMTTTPTARTCSIVIPLYNREALISGCLDSLRPALDLGCEVIVVDDGSSDQGPQVVEAWAQDHSANVRCIKQANAGPGAARNTGVAATDRAWIIFVDSDDMWLPWSADKVMQAIEAHPDSHAVFLATDDFGDHTAPVSGWRAAPDRIAAYETFFQMRGDITSGLIGSGCLVIRREVFTALGGFDGTVRSAEDTDLFFRMTGPVARVDAPVIVAVRSDANDRLTLSATATAQGLRFSLAQLRAGAYPDPAAAHAVTDGLCYWLHALCNTGHGKVAYGIFFGAGGARLMLAQGRYKEMVRLMLHPLLALIRPKNYSFGWAKGSS